MSKKNYMVLAVFWTHFVFAESGDCDLVSRVIAEGTILDQKEGMSYFSGASKVAFYKVNMAAGAEFVPVLTVAEGKRYLMSLEWNGEEMPEVEDVWAQDFDGNERNELVVLLKQEGYLREYSSVGSVYDIFVFVDEDSRLRADPCQIENYPLLSDYFRSVRIGEGADACDRGLCSVKDIMKRLTQLQQKSKSEFLEEAHKFALESFKGKMLRMAARSADVGLMYPELLSDSTVTIFNDFGYFKEQAEQYKDARFWSQSRISIPTEWWCT